MPFILLTNGGGVTEEKRIKLLSDELEVDLKPSQLIQSHTPYVVGCLANWDTNVRE